MVRQRCKLIHENKCREILERIFSKPFPKCKPHWLLGLHGRPLELDGYNAELRICFEFQGKQHYEVSRKWKVNKYKLRQIKIRDALKVKICKRFNVTLIVIPYTVVYDKIEEYIIKELHNAGISPLYNTTYLSPLIS